MTDYLTDDWPSAPPMTALVNRVLHTDALSLLAMLPSASVDAVITDPPYGVGKQVSARRSPEFRFDEIVGAYEINNSWIMDAYRALKDGGAIYVFAKWLNMGEWKHELEAVGFDVRNCIIWDKLQHGSGDLFGAYAPQYEMILFAVKGSHKLRGKRPIDIIRYPKVQPTQLTHPYEKPVGLLKRLIESSTDKGDLVIDCFSGSGAALEASRELNRRWIGCDIDKEHAALARRRLAQPFTPMFAELAG